MRQVAQFFGSKIVIRPVLSLAKVEKAEETVRKALDGKLKFAWRRITPSKRRHYTSSTLKDLLRKDHRTLEGQDYEDVAKHKRAESWNRRNVHSLFPADSLIAEWKLNLTRIKRACSVLKVANVVEYSRVSGDGRMEIRWKSNGKVSRFHDRCGKGIKTSKRGQMPENEKLARFRGKLHNLTPKEYNEAVGMERKRRLDEFKRGIFSLYELGKKIKFIPRAKLEEVYRHLLPLIPETGIPFLSCVSNFSPFRDVIITDDVNEEKRGLFTAHVPKSGKFVSDHDYESLVKAANERLADKYGKNRYFEQRELWIYQLTLINIFKIKQGVPQPASKQEVVRHESAVGIAVNIH